MSRVTFAAGRPRARLPGRWLLLVVVALLVVLPFRLTVEPPAPPEGWHVNVRWAPGVDERARLALESSYHLRPMQAHAERTWIYRLGDTSRSNIRALVTDPRVEDTHGIDRQAFTVSAPRVTVARRIADKYPREVARILDTASWRNAFVVLAAVLIVMPRGRKRLAALLAKGVPSLSPAGLGLYRFALATGLIALVIDYTELPDQPFPRELHRSADWFAHWEWVHTLASGPGIDSWTTPLLVVLLCAFAVGLLARPVYVAFLAVLTVHVLVTLQYKSVHDWGLPLVTLCGLAVVPWSDGTGFDRWRRSTLVPPRDYGFAVWFPGLMIGLAFAAAAYAKLNSSGVAWVTEGAVKYHFIEDFRQAPTMWGLWIATHEPAAIAVSAVAILIEGLFILNVLFRNAWVRTAFGLAGVSVLLGFRLLQGIVWSPWWLLFLCFVPWQPIAQRLVRSVEAEVPVGAGPLRGPAFAVVALALIVQAYASLHRFEAEPFVSDYGMYSWTWPSRVAFDSHTAGKYRQYSYRQWFDGATQRDVTGRIREIPKAADVFADAVELLRSGERLGDERRRALQIAVERYRDEYGEPLGRVLVLVHERVFDWQTGRFVVKSNDMPTGILDPLAATFVPVPAVEQVGRPH